MRRTPGVDSWRSPNDESQSTKEGNCLSEGGCGTDLWYCPVASSPCPRHHHPFDHWKCGGPNRGGIPNASVSATSESTGATFKALANGQGVFLISDVPLGSYAVTVTSTGFGASRFNHVVVVAGNASSMGKIGMNLGATAQTVQVEADTAALVNTESSTDRNDHRYRAGRVSSGYRCHG